MGLARGKRKFHGRGRKHTGGGVFKRLKRVEKRVRRVSKMAKGEWKRKDTQLADQVILAGTNATFGATSISNIAGGDGLDQRDGNAIHARMVSYRFILSAAKLPVSPLETYVRIMIVRAGEGTGATAPANLNQIVRSSAGSTNTWWSKGLRRGDPLHGEFDILHDRIHMLYRGDNTVNESWSTPPITKLVHGFAKMNGYRTEFSSAASTAETRGALYLLYWGLREGPIPSNADSMVMDGQVTFYYTEN